MLQLSKIHPAAEHSHPPDERRAISLQAPQIFRLTTAIFERALLLKLAELVAQEGLKVVAHALPALRIEVVGARDLGISEKSGGMLTLEQFVEQPLALNRSHVEALIEPRNLPRLRELVGHSDFDVAERAAQLLAVAGDELAVPELLQAAQRHLPEPFLEALLECGVAGREALANLCLSPNSLAEAAGQALVTGLSRPALRPAIFAWLGKILQADNSAPAPRILAFKQLFLRGWLSSEDILAPLLPQETWEKWVENCALPLFPAARSALQSIPPPYLASVRALISQQIVEAGRRESERLPVLLHFIEEGWLPHPGLAPILD